MSQYENIKLNSFIKIPLTLSDFAFIFRVQDYPLNIPV